MHSEVSHQGHCQKEGVPVIEILKEVLCLLFVILPLSGGCACFLWKLWQEEKRTYENRRWALEACAEACAAFSYYLEHRIRTEVANETNETPET